MKVYMKASIQCFLCLEPVKDALTKRKEDVLGVFEHYAMELTISVPTNGCVIEKMVILFYLC